jgi:hypothetical protein
MTHTPKGVVDSVPYTVAIIDAPEALAVKAMWVAKGYQCLSVTSPSDLKTYPQVKGLDAASAATYDLVCFVGGEDVTPALYGEPRHPTTYSNLPRDIREINIYESIPKDIPKIGICRGGQFLHVMNSGKMIQDIPGHRNTIHGIYSYEHDDYLSVNSDHHQAMLITDPKKCELIARAPNYLGSFSEIIYYPDTKSLCFQPHPEWGHKPTEDYFFSLLNHYFGL